MSLDCVVAAKYARRIRFRRRLTHSASDFLFTPLRSGWIWRPWPINELLHDAFIGKRIAGLWSIHGDDQNVLVNAVEGEEFVRHVAIVGKAMAVENYFVDVTRYIESIATRAVAADGLRGECSHFSCESRAHACVRGVPISSVRGKHALTEENMIVASPGCEPWFTHVAFERMPVR